MKSAFTMNYTNLILGASLRKEGRLKRFEKTYSDWEPYVRRTLFWLVPKSSIDDLTQNVFVKIWKHQSKFRGDSSEKTWIYRITVNAAYDFFKKENPSSELSERMHKTTNSLEKDLVIKDVIRKGINVLDPKHRTVFVLFYKQEQSIQEIAKIMKLPAGTVKSRLHKARKLFTEHLERNGVNHDQ